MRSAPVTRYRAASDMLRVAASPRGGAMGYAPWTRRARHLDEIDWGILERALSPGTLDEHAARIAELAASPLPDLRERLARLAEHGFLIDTRELTEVKPTGASPATITRLGVPTRARPELLSRCVAEWLEVARRHGRELEIVVADDGRTLAECAPTRAALEALAGGIRVAYAGPEERLRYAAALAEEANVEPSLVAWALYFAPPELSGEGTARNAILLDSIDRGLLFVDDDTRCRFAPAPGMQSALTLTGHSPFEAWFPEPGQPATSLVSTGVIDACEMLEAVLGRDVHELVTTFETSFDAAPSLMCRNLRDFGGRVRAAQCGIAGDVATGSLAHYLMFSGPSRHRLLRSRAVYEHALRSRQGVTGATAWAIADLDHCMTYLLALDARAPLPPFVAMGRNCDGLYGAIYRRSSRDDYMAFAPWVVEHAATPRSSSRQHMIDTAPVLYGNDLLLRLVQGAPLEPVAGSIEEGVRSVGRALVHAAARSPGDFVELVWHHVVRGRTHDLMLLENVLRAHGGQPAWWASDVRSVFDNLHHLLTRPAIAHPHDLARVYGAERAMIELQARARRYGELLVAWPDLWEAARRLAENQIRVAEPL